MVLLRHCLDQTVQGRTVLIPTKTEDEIARIEALRASKLLDTSPEERFDRLTRLAKRLFGVPIALVSLIDVDRQWFKSCIGLSVTETSRDISFCGHAILGSDVFVIPDARADERFIDNPLVTGPPYIRFYAGCPLQVANGSKLGTLCLIDVEAREFDADSVELLQDLAKMAEQEIAALQLATMDGLTSLSNRRGFDTLAQHALSVCKRLERPACLLFFDLNGFKQINDTFGHAEGDRALSLFAEELRAIFRDSDVIGRIGGDEFSVLLTDSNSASTSVILSRLQESINARILAESRSYNVRYSVGCVEFEAGRHGSVVQLLADADSAMYAHKQATRSD